MAYLRPKTVPGAVFHSSRHSPSAVTASVKSPPDSGRNGSPLAAEPHRQSAVGSLVVRRRNCGRKSVVPDLAAGDADGTDELRVVHSRLSSRSHWQRVVRSAGVVTQSEAAEIVSGGPRSRSTRRSLLVLRWTAQEQQPATAPTLAHWADQT